MNQIELKRVLLLVFILAAIAIIIDRTRTYTPRPTIVLAKPPIVPVTNQVAPDPIPIHPLTNNYPPPFWRRTDGEPRQAADAQPASATPQPMAVHPVIWPGDVPATKIIYIPDPKSPTTGVMDITIRPGDELEMDFAPLWTWGGGNDLPATLEYALKRDGDNFEEPAAYRRRFAGDNSGPNSSWAKSRTARFRLKASSPETTFRITITKIPDEYIKPLPSVPSQWIGDLRVDFTKIQKIKDGTVQVDLTFHNSAPFQTMATAMYGDVCPFEPCPVSSSLIGSDGTLCILESSGLTGIQCMHALPMKLTAIAPNGTLNASLNFEPRSNFSGIVRSFRLETQIVVDANYTDTQFSSYRPTHDLPPHCTVANLVFDIPVR